jgi:Na+-translocating ferredoxin:NAD+ oxidoreductase subunit E
MMHPLTCCGGLWRENPLLVRLLGLCPLLALCDRVVMGLAVGVLVAVVMLWTQLLSAVSSPLIPVAVRLPVQAIYAALAVMVLQLLLQTFRIELHTQMGMYLPVTAGCCLVLVRAQGHADAASWRAAGRDSLIDGLAVLTVALGISVVRELLAYGSLFRDLAWLLPDSSWTGLQLLAPGMTLPIAAMPAGALMIFAALLALRNATMR